MWEEGILCSGRRRVEWEEQGTRHNVQGTRDKEQGKEIRFEV